MPPSKRKTVASAAPERPKGRVYRHEQLIHTPASSKAIPGLDTAAVMAAINAGERPNGDAYVERTEECDNGRASLVVWAVPVVEVAR